MIWPLRLIFGGVLVTMLFATSWATTIAAIYLHH